MFEVPKLMDFENLLGRIRNGDLVKSSELLPYLCLENREERCLANLRLAEAYLKIGNFQQAKIFINRSWILSKFSPDILPLYIEIHSALNDIDSIQKAYKRLGMVEASKNNLTGALKYFNLWQYAYTNHFKLDKYDYDFDILECIERMANPYQFNMKLQIESLPNRKIRLAYLMFGMTHVNSVIVKINLLLAKYHNKDRFEVVFFVPEPKSAIDNWRQAKDNIKLLTDYNCKIVIAPDAASVKERLLAVANQIYNYKPDILITSALLAEFEHYFIASLRPAPIIIGLLQGPPPQFVAHSLDWCISWSKHPLIDSPCHCSLVQMGVDLPDRKSINSYTKQDLNIPENSQILMSGGRYTKFQDLDLWKSVLNILSHFSNLYYVVVGISKEQIPFLDELLTPELSERLRLLGWRENCLNIFCLADVVIDTFPSGGGHVLIDAAALGIPFVSFENNYFRTFDQTDWSVADEFVSIPDLIVNRGDFEQFKNVVSKLIEDKEYRNKMGNLCKEQIHLKIGKPEQGVSSCENIYLRILNNKLRENLSTSQIATNTDGNSTCSMKVEAQEPAANKPTPPDFLLKTKSYPFPIADVIDCVFFPIVNQNFYELELTFRSIGDQTHTKYGRFMYSSDWESTQNTIINPILKRTEIITLKSIFELWSGGYDFKREPDNYLKTIISVGKKPSIAFTVIDSEVMGGGTLILFRYANWLAELGVNVAVYSNNKPPKWMEVKARFNTIPDPLKRYSAIKESIIIVYSVLELPVLLRTAETKNRKIIHLCQGVEDFHYYNPSKDGFDIDLPIFQVIHSLPVGRLVTSPHLRKYFKIKYHQRSYTIVNGIDTSLFIPRPSYIASLKDTVTIMVSGDPEHPLKRIDDVVKAAFILANKKPHVKFHIINVSSVNSFPYDDPCLYRVDNLKYSLFCELSPEEMRKTYYNADIFVNASWYEGFGLPSLEAMACGVPVVQAANYGLDEIAEDGVNSLIVPTCQPERIAEAIEKILSDENLYLTLVKNGIKTALRFSIASQYKIFVDEFEKILGCQFDRELVEKKKSGLLSGVDTANVIKTKKLSDNRLSNPLISVLVPSYNQAEYLPQTLDSLLAQTYQNWEAVIVNDGSTDSTPQVLEQYANKDPRFRVFHKENGGCGSALNEALRNARGEWICWLSSDDMFVQNKLEVHLYGFKKYPGIKVFHTDYLVLNNETRMLSPSGINPHELYPPPQFQLIRFFTINYYNGITICIHKSVFDRVGFFKENLRNAQDFDMWLRISAHYQSQFIPKQTCITRINPSSGTVLSVEAGLFDSGRACLEFLNQHSFPELYPMLNLQKEDDIFLAVQNIFNTLFIPTSYINRCGYSQAVIDRLREWFAHSCPKELKAPYEETFKNINSNVQKSSLSEEIKGAFNSLMGSTYSDFKYRPYDPLKEINRHAENLKKFGKHHEATLIRQYLERVKQFEKNNKVIDKPSSVIENDNIVTQQGLLSEIQRQPKDKMKILFVVHSFHTDNLSGTELYTYNLAQKLRKRGHSVRILYPEYDMARPVGAVTEITLKGLPITRFNLHPPQNMVQQFMNEQTGNTFRQYLSGLQVDLVHFHHFIGFTASPLQICAQMGIPVMVTLHDEWMLCEQFHYLQADGRFCTGPETVEKCVNCFVARHPEVSSADYMSDLFQIFTLRRQFLQNVLNGVDTLIVPSRFLQEELKKHGFLHPNTLLIPFGLYSFNALPWESQEGLLRFTYLGNIHPTKGLDVVIQAFNLLNTGNIQLNIYGTIQHPVYFQQVMNMNLKREIVKYHGPYKPEDLPGILSKTDAAVIPSRSESYSFVVRECLHAHVPVIASRVGGIPEIVKDGENGLLFESNNYRDLASKLHFLVQNPKKLAAFRKRIQPVRNIVEDAEELVVIYREILARQLKSE